MWTGPALIAPLWQGSSITTPEQAQRGATVVADALVDHDWRARTVTLDPPTHPRGREAVEVMRQRVEEALRECAEDDRVLLIGGDCSVDLALIRRRLSSRATVVWFDAHADANTPESSPSGAPHGMVAREALEGRTHTLRYVGVRACDPEERQWIDEHAIPVLGPSVGPQGLLAEVPDGQPVHIHLDLDVLDPPSFSGLGFPEPAGMSPRTLATLLEALCTTRDVRSLTVTEHVPGDRPEQDAQVLRLLAAALR